MGTKNWLLVCYSGWSIYFLFENSKIKIQCNKVTIASVEWLVRKIQCSRGTGPKGINNSKALVTDNGELAGKLLSLPYSIKRMG